MRNHLATAAFAAGLALSMSAPAAHAQKALVYCPVGVDATGCDRIVSALQPKFAAGVDRGYDGSNGTLDLTAIDLNHYSVFVVPSLADDGDKQPYAVLRAAAARLHLAINGRVAVYSGAPDQGNANRADKDAIIQNLATWAAAGHTRATSLVGMVALLDLSTNSADRYMWVRSVSLADVSADAELQSFGDVTAVSSRNGEALLGGASRRFSNMASYGLHIGNHAAARTEVGALGVDGAAESTGQSVLVLYSNADAGSSRSKAGGASLDVSANGGGSGPTLTTDKPDYLPGDTVLFTGAGWASGDTVTITVHEDPQWSNPDRTVRAVADANGNLRSHDFVVQPRDFGVTFTATAVGNPSGLVAQITFTDGIIAIVSNTAVLASTTQSGTCGTVIPATFLVNTEYCGQTTITSISGTGATTLSMRWVRPNGSVACGTGIPGVVVGSTYAAKCTPDAPSTATADWTFQVSAQSNFNPVLAAVLVHVVANTPPVANNDSYSINEDAPLSIAAPGVLGNDTDAEHNPLTAVLLTGPAHGTLTLNANGSFTYTPAANYNGSDSFTYKANDGTVNSNTGATVSITVNAVNDAPSFTKGSDQTALEDAGAQSVANWATGISAGPADEAGQTLTFVVSGNSNPSLFAAAPAVSASGALTYTPAPNANGSATITLKLTDNGGTANGGVDASGEQTFVINLTAVNDAPSFMKGADQTANENAGAQTAAGWATALSAGPPDEAGQALTFEVSNNNNALFSAQPSIDPTGKLTYTSATDVFGTATVTVKLHDNGGTANGGVDVSAAQTFTITINPINHAPSFVKGADQTRLEDAGAQSVANWATSISAGPPNESGQIISFQITANTNPGLFSTGPTVSSNGTLTYAPAPDANGSATITIVAKDDGGTANGGVDTSPSQQFTITITPVNDAPTFGLIASHTVLEDAGPQSVANALTNPSAGPANESGQQLTLSVTNNNNALFSVQPSIDLGSGTLTYTPATGSNGNAIVTVTVSDNGGTDNGGVDHTTKTLTITVTAVNDAPSFTNGASQTVLEDAGAQSVSGWATSISAGPSNEAAQALDFIVTNDNNALFSSQPAVDATGKLTYTPAPNRNGTATVTVKLHDNGGTANGGVDTSPAQTFTITITPVNDAPTFNLLANNTAAEDAGPQVIGGALTNASPGPFESGQALTLVVTNDNNALFSVQPSIDLATGTLKYTSAPNANGSATVTVKLQDDGGTANGGVDQTTKTFTITVTPVDDAPVITTFYGPVQPIALGGSFSVTGTFNDVDLGDVPPDSHTGTIDWGDGTTSSLTITPGSGTTRSFGGTHTYAAPGVYTIVAHIKDAGGLSVDATCKYPVVVFDSNGSFVTGGGWVASPAGKSAFGLVSKYNKGQATPDGDTEFQGPGFNFKSTSSDWLVIVGAKAQYRGSGTVNGNGDYAFMVTVVDGSLTAKHGSDMFRIKIWDKSSGLVIYDNQPGAPDSANPTTATGGGSIRIHN